MKTRTRTVLCLLGLAPLFLVCSADAGDKFKGPKRSPGHCEEAEFRVNAPPEPAGRVVMEASAPSHGQEPWVGVKVVFSADEQRIIQGYAHDCHEHDKAHWKGKRLPPGLAKKVARGGQLPPGWQKKCVRGEVLSEEVYRQCHPLPREVVVQLPPPPPGTILVAVSGKVVRLAKATREILDVFDVRF